MAKGKMTTCSHCGAEIAAGAKTCPKCGGKISKPIYKRVWFWLLMLVLVVGIGGAAGGSGGSGSASKDSQKEATVQEEPAAQTEQSGDAAQSEAPAQEEVIEYTPVTVDEMSDALDNNPAAASDAYKGKYFAVTGRLSNIDSSGKYITLDDINDEWSFKGVSCYIKSEEQLNRVKELSMNQEVTVRGKITSVGEVMGYSMDIDSID